jgi:MFS superfamily sulfate permease-like transporter
MSAVDDPIQSPSMWLADIVAGVSMAGLLLPEAVAYSGIAGMPPQAGVLGLFAGLLVYGLIGKSRFAIVSATSSSAAVLGAATLSIAGPDAALRAALGAGLVLATGTAFVMAGVARLGSICNFISKPVLRGFSFGLAITIVVKQLPKMTGVHPQGSVLPTFAYQLFAALPHWNWLGVALGLAALLALKALSGFRKLPGALFVIAAGIALGQWFDIKSRGVDLVGSIALTLTVPALPELSRGQWLGLGEMSLALVVLLFAESYGAIRSMALKHGDNTSPNRDLLAFGGANLLSGLFHGTPVGAGYSATSANEAAGAMSGKAAWVAAVVVLLLVLIFLPLIELTPEPVLAAVVVHAVSHTLTLGAFRPYFQWRRDRVVVVAAALAVVLLGVLDGLLAGIAISLAMTLRGLSEPRVSELGRLGDGHDFLSCDAHPDVRRIAGVLLLRPEAPLFFANVERTLTDARERIAAARPRGLVLSLEETPDLDGTSIEALIDFAAEQVRSNVTLVLARLKDPVPALLQSTIGDASQPLLEPGSVDDAVTRPAQMLGGEELRGSATKR